MRKLVLLLCFTLLFLVQCFAQPQNPNLPQDNPVPITGIEYLLLAGGALGGRKLFLKMRNKTA